MNHQKFCTFGDSAALKYAASALWSYGWEYDASSKNILLPVPSFDSEGRVKGGGRLEDIISDDSVIWGGNLNCNVLSSYRCVDLLQDPIYVAENAAITAYCAISLAAEKLPIMLSNCPVLIIGWGRIGKCLAFLLRQIQAKVTVYARKSADRGILSALGYEILEDINDVNKIQSYRLIFNTVPAMILNKETVTSRQLCIDLASVRGMEGDNVIWARGLPGTLAPESSGILIAKTMDRLGKELAL